MSVFKRIKNIIKKSDPPKLEKSILMLGPGDIAEISLVTYEVKGRTTSAKRSETFLTLQDGNIIRYLKIEQREKLYYKLYSPIDGRLDSIHEVPSTIEMDNVMYHLEDQYTCYVSGIGYTPFSASGEQHIWEFQSDNRKLLRIEWQDGRMMMYEGEAVLPADVQIIRAT